MATGMSLRLEPVGFDVTARRMRAAAQRFEPAEMEKTNMAVVKAMEEYHARTWGRGIVDSPQTLIRHPEQIGPLELTGALKNSMTKSFAEGAVRVVTPYSIEYGTSIFYGRFLNDGTRYMPPKPFMRFNTPLKQIIRSVYIERLMRAGLSIEGMGAGPVKPLEL